MQKRNALKGATAWMAGTALVFIQFLICTQPLFATRAVVLPAPMDTPYVPARGQWVQKTPAQLGMNAALLTDAEQLAKAGESPNPRDMEENHYRSFGKEPFGEAIGPFETRGAPTGLVIFKGYLVASWGEPLKPDMTHSVTKSFLSTTVGLAVQAGLISSVKDKVAPYVAPIETWPSPAHRPAEAMGTPELLHPFASAHNQSISWEHLLQQSSDWEGTLWGKPDWADRPDPDPRKWLNRPRHTPGTVFEYNDVRVNVLALAATSVWRKPLPEVLREKIMDPIGASSTWRWNGYRNAWIVLDGRPVQSVSGGGHWGGGMVISAEDMARFGLLCLRQGKWGKQQILDPAWLAAAETPSPAKNDYGYMNYFLNTSKALLPSAPEKAYYHLGNGNNLIYVDRANDLVVVLRWIETKSIDPVLGKIIAALPKAQNP